MRRRIYLFVGILWISFHSFGFAQTITRGPYLQLGTQESVVVRWRTDTPTDSRVLFGNSPENLFNAAENNDNTTEHEVMVQGLQPDTHYYYAIGSSDSMLAGDSTYFFVTSPVPGTSKPTRIWVLGDSGSKDDRPRAVRDAYNNFTGERHTDLWLMLGDNAYLKGSQSDHQKAIFENMFEAMLRKSVLWPSIGNHDVDTPSTPGPYPYMDIFTLPTNGEAGGFPSGTEEYYSFDYGNIHFIVLNSENDDLVEADSEMWDWLDQDLAANERFWLIAYFHHPTYSKGTHDSDDESTLIDMRETALPVLEAAGVDLVMMGHSHAYERSFMIDGHYDESDTFADSMIVDSGDGRPDGDGAYVKNISESSAHKGTVYMVLGSSSWPQEGGSLDHPIMVTSQIELGSVILDFDENIIDGKFLDAEGNIDDYFTLIKQGPPVISIAPQSFDFGDALVDSVKTTSFSVENTGTSNLVVSGINFTGIDSLFFGYNNISLPASIAPNSSVQFSVYFQPESAGLKSAVMQIESNDPANDTLKAPLYGIGFLPPPKLTLSPTQYDYGDVLVDSSSAQNFLAKNTGGSPLHLTGIDIAGKDSVLFKTENLSLPDTLAPEDSIQFTIIFSPSTEGAKNATLIFEGNVPGIDSMQIKLSGVGYNLPPQISVSPISYDFGNVVVGQTEANNFKVWNTGGSLSHLTGAAFVGKDSLQFNTENLSLPDTLAPEDSIQFTVIFSPSTVGAKIATLLFEGDAPDIDSIQINLSGTGFNPPPQISVSPVSHNFGDVIVDSVETQSIKVWNIGGSDLLITNFRFTGSDSSSFSINNLSAPVTIAAGDSQELMISFAPVSQKLLTASLWLQHNDITNADIEILLEGRGISGITDFTGDSDNLLPEKLTLSPNYPNPFNNETVIEYGLPEDALVRIAIYNVLGQRIKTLVDEFRQAGYQKVNWDGRNDAQDLVVSGVYFCKMQVGNLRLVEKVLLQK